jgi:ribokinase
VGALGRLLDRYVGLMPGGRVVVVGSVNVDQIMRLPRLPAAGETVLGGVIARAHGGKGANQAVAAARAGAQVQLIGAVGAADGQDSIDALVADGVDTRHVLRTDRPTGTAVVLVDDRTGENQIAVAPGANAAVSARHARECLLELDLTPVDVVVLSCELPGAPLRAAAIVACRAGARLVVNPAPAHPDHLQLLSGALTTPNERELAVLTAAGGTAAAKIGVDTGVAGAATALSRQTRAPVVVTLGARGALVADQGATEYVAARRVRARDTTGAGDTLTGVLAASLAEGQDVHAAVQRAVLAATLAVMREGARDAMPTAAEIDSLLAH